MSVRLTEDQYRMLSGERLPTRESKARVRKDRDSLPENMVEAQILGWLRSRGWTVERQQAGTLVGLSPMMAIARQGRVLTMEVLSRAMVRVGQKGTPDWTAWRRAVCSPANSRPLYDRFCLEIKAPGKKPSPEQIECMRRINALGDVAVWADRLLPSDKGESVAFVRWYEEKFGG